MTDPLASNRTAHNSRCQEFGKEEKEEQILPKGNFSTYDYILVDPISHSFFIHVVQFNSEVGSI